MSGGFSVSISVWLFTAVAFPITTLAQSSSPGGWRDPVWDKPPITAQNRKPAPRHSLAGTSGTGCRSTGRNAGRRRAVET